jgi:hypothetical protein
MKTVQIVKEVMLIVIKIVNICRYKMYNVSLHTKSNLAKNSSFYLPLKKRAKVFTGSQEHIKITCA